MDRDRGTYGDQPDRPKKSLLPALVIGGAILVVIVGTAPGTLHFFKHGYLPEHDD